MMKRLKSLFLSLCMLASLLPASVVCADAAFQQRQDGIVWMEAENATENNGFSEYSSNGKSNGKATKVNLSGQATGTKKSLTFNFNISQTGDYEVWALVSNPNVTHLSYPYFGIDGGETKRISNYSGYQRDSAVIYNVTLAGSSQNVYWAKFDYTFSAGDHTIQYEVTKRAMDTGGTGYILNVLDCVVIAPKSLEVKPSGITLAPETKIFEPNSDGVILLEAEDGTTGGDIAMNAGSGATGEYMLTRTNISDDNTKTATLAFEFTVEKQESYDVWALISNPDADYISKPAYNWDDGGFETINQEFYGGFGNTNKPYTVDTDIDLFWKRIRVNNIFEAGNHSLVYKVGKRNIDNMIIAAIDCVAIVPTRLNWTPNGAEMPDTANELHSYNWIELEGEKTASGFDIPHYTGDTSSYNDASNKSLLYAYTKNVGDGDQKIIETNYDFTVTKSGEYDLYFLGAIDKGDANTIWLSRAYWDIDNNAPYQGTSANRISTNTVSSNAVYTVNGMKVMWHKMAENKYIEAGGHTLTIEYTHRNVDNATDHCVVGDVVLVVPHDWNWSIPESSEKVSTTAAKLDLQEEKTAIEQECSAGVTDNIVFHKRGTAGSYLTHTSNNTTVLTNSGVVTRPQYGEQDAQGVLSVTANRYISATDASSNPRTYAYEYTSGQRNINFTVPSEDVVDFVVDVESGRDVKVLQLTDPQIIDTSQGRTQDRRDSTARWKKDTKEEEYKKYMRQVITRYNPDLILLTGDLVYGEFDDTGESMLDLVEFMEGFEIPWAPIFGNHENESHEGVDWQCEQLENAEYCLFKQRTLTGNGNYTVGIRQDGTIKRVFFMLDSNGCANMSDESKANGHSKTSCGFGEDQIEWYTTQAQIIKGEYPNAKISFAFHIQPQIFETAFSKYGFPDARPINLDEVGDEGDFGYLGRKLKTPFDANNNVWNGIKNLGADSIFVGHEHCNSASVVYEGVRLQYGQKSSTYDRCNYRQEDGTIVGSSAIAGEPVIGGTAMELDNTGTITNPHIIYWQENSSEAEETYNTVYDFNGDDFDCTVNNSDIKIYKSSKTNDMPAGGSGYAYMRSDKYIVDVGMKFDKSLKFDNIKSVTLRMYVSEYTPTKTPLVRIYNDSENAILSGANYTDIGGKFGEWCDVDITNLVKTAGVNDIILVYRCYAQDAINVYFDSVTFEYEGSMFELPYYSVSSENSNTTVSVFVNSEYNTKTAIAAAYDSEGRMIDVGYNTIADNTANITIYTENINKLSVFVWDTIQLMKPLFQIEQ
ncbi:MAG: metallophosphoesterase, partial [Firmicutes bacterium]|nr:metallophosphoesterase [Bacillota bacterium]